MTGDDTETLTWSRSAARVSGFSAACLEDRLVVRVELTVASAGDACALMRQLAALRSFEGQVMRV